MLLLKCLVSPMMTLLNKCEFLRNAGYMAVKVFPASESILTFDTVEEGN